MKNTLTGFVSKLKDSDEDRNVKNFEVRLSVFFAEHNVALQVVDHLLPLLKEAVPDSNIIKKASLGRTKCTGIVKNVLAHYEKMLLVDTLRITKFSILTDESTGISLNKCMCVLVRYVNAEGKVITQLLDLLKLNAQKCDAEQLYSSIKEGFHDLDIPMSNDIGMCSDNASVMVGCNNSFASRLQKDNENVIIINCICHSAAIIANKACLSLPRAPEELLRLVATYFSVSSKRCEQLEEIQEFFHQSKKKILRASATRWLSLQKCVIRVLEYWDVLIAYFRVAVVEDKLRSAEVILNELQNVCNKAYLYFLKYVLDYFNSLNALFQSKKPLIHVLHSESKKLFFKIAQNFVKKQKLHVKVNIRDPDNYLKIEDTFVGAECANLLSTIPQQQKERVLLGCLQFYIVSIEEIQKRLPLEDDLFEEVQFLHPVVALGIDQPLRNTIKFKKLCDRFNLPYNSVVKEWRELPYNFSDSQIKNMAEKDIDEFWCLISGLKNYDNEEMYPNLAILSR